MLATNIPDLRSASAGRVADRELFMPSRERYQITTEDPLGPPATGEQARARARLERLTERFLEPDDLAPDPGL